MVSISTAHNINIDLNIHFGTYEHFLLFSDKGKLSGLCGLQDVRLFRCRFVEALPIFRLPAICKLLQFVQEPSSYDRNKTEQIVNDT